MPRLKNGELRVTIDYQHLAQDVKVAMAFLQRLNDKLDIAAIQEGIKKSDRRIGERRSKLFKGPRENVHKSDTGAMM